MHKWQEFLHAQEKRLGKETTSRWLSSLKVTHFDAQNLFLEAKDTFQIAWFKEHVHPILKSSFFNGNGRPIRVHIFLQGEKPKQLLRKSSKKLLSFFSPQEDSLDPNKTFLKFFLSTKNTLPFQILSHILGNTPEKELKSQSLNPCFLHGNSGSGKTHLLMGATEELKRQGKKVFYVHAQTFTDHVVHAIRSGNMQEFRKYYRNLDALLIDDIHIFSKKNATQEEFFHTFNALYQTKSLLIFSSNVPPSQLVAIEPRLISRFEWGIVLAVEPLERDDLKKALFLKAEDLGLSLTEKGMDFLITTFHSQIIRLQQALETFALRQGKERKIGTIEELEHTLYDLIQEAKKSIPSIQKISQTIVDYYGIRLEDLLGKSQIKEICLPRKLTMYLCRKKLQMPFVKIGEVFHRDHSTVMSSIRFVEKEIEKKKELFLALSQIMTLLRKL